MLSGTLYRSRLEAGLPSKSTSRDAFNVDPTVAPKDWSMLVDGDPNVGLLKRLKNSVRDSSERSAPSENCLVIDKLADGIGRQRSASGEGSN
jgi:hypothetical protein